MTTTYVNAEGYNTAVNALKTDYDAKVLALRQNNGRNSHYTMQRGIELVRSNPALAVGGALTVGLLVGALIGRRTNRYHITSQ